MWLSIEEVYTAFCFSFSVIFLFCSIWSHIFIFSFIAKCHTVCERSPCHPSIFFVPKIWSNFVRKSLKNHFHYWFVDHSLSMYILAIVCFLSWLHNFFFLINPSIYIIYRIVKNSALIHICYLFFFFSACFALDSLCICTCICVDY